MFRDRIFLWILFSLTVTAGLLLGFEKQELCIIFFIAVSILAVSFTYSVNASVKSFSKKHLPVTTSSLSKFLTLVENNFSDQQKEVKQLILAIERIGTSEVVATSNLNGEIGQAIINLQDKLVQVKQTEEQRVWAAQGIATLSEIRKDNATLAEYSFQIISQLVKFLGANQGAFYVLSDDNNNPSLELLSTYAYGKRKYAFEKVVLELGTGLVGQCALCKEMILMTDVPNDYVKITSGLGEALPRCIVIVPLLFRNEIFGVLEMASFQKFESHHLEFLSKACETIGLELSGIKTQERTRKLLEQSREEELRQNLEDMKLTQQKMLMKEEELSNQLATTQRAMAMAEAEQRKNEAILEGCMDAVISFNQEGEVEFFNKAAEEVFGISRYEAIGRSVENLFKIQIVEADNDFKIISSTGNEVSLRTEINALDNSGEVISLLLTATKVKINRNHLFTLFAQKVSVELF